MNVSNVPLIVRERIHNFLFPTSLLRLKKYFLQVQQEKLVEEKIPISFVFGETVGEEWLFGEMISRSLFIA